jgi:SPP1 family predicted phage head-tail adaptor
LNVNTDKRVRLEYPAKSKDSGGAPVVTWTLLAVVWAEVRDDLPSRAEQNRAGLEQARNPTRVRMRYRSDLNTSMRVRDGSRILQIIGGPAMIGRREWTEIFCEAIT